MREQMAEHRANPACRHLPQSDGPRSGFALENFERSRAWRHALNQAAQSMHPESSPTGTFKINGVVNAA